jgi:hypothetical protein
MRRAARIFSVALVTAGLVLLVDAGITIAWKEPLSAVYSKFRQSAATDELDRVRRDFLEDPEVLEIGRTRPSSWPPSTGAASAKATRSAGSRSPR